MTGASRLAAASSEAGGWWSSAVAQRLLFALLLVLFYPQADQYLARTVGLPLPPTLLFFVLAAPLLAAVAWREATLRRRASPLLAALARGVAGWGPLAVLAVISLLWALHPGAFWQGGLRYIFLPTYDVAVLLSLLAVGTLPAVRGSWRRWLTLAFLALFLTTLWDVLAPGTFSKQMGRAAGLAGNANASAALLVASCAALLEPAALRRRDGLLLAATAVGVLATLSRSGVVLLALLVAGYLLALAVALRQRPARSALRRLAPMVLSIALALGAALVLAQEGVGMFERPTARARIGMLTGERSVMSSDEGRFVLLRRGWEQVSSAPIVGHGTGASYRGGRGSHNVYLDLWAQFGLAGLLAYLAFLAGGTWVFARRRFVPGLLLMPVIVFWGLFQHGLLDERGLMMLYGLLLAVSAPSPAAESSSERAVAAAGSPADSRR